MDYSKYIIKNNGLVFKRLKNGDTPLVPIQDINGIPKVRINKMLMPLDKVVVEALTGTEVGPEEQIRHIDGNNFNCRLDNLVIEKIPVVGDIVKIDGREVKIVIPGYGVTREGEVYNIAKGNKLSPIKTVHGYLVIHAHNKLYPIHRLVATAFIPNPENKVTVDHINENKEDNRVTNLRWATISENIAYYNDIKKSREYTLLKNKFDKLKKVLKSYNKERKEMIKERRYHQKIVEQLEKKNKRLEDEIDKATKLFATLSKQNAKAIAHSSVNKQSSKAVKINGKVFHSIHSASKFIVEKENELGNIRNLDTIRKELRKLYKGTRGAWYMYDRYFIELPS